MAPENGVKSLFFKELNLREKNIGVLENGQSEAYPAEMKNKLAKMKRAAKQKVIDG